MGAVYEAVPKMAIVQPNPAQKHKRQAAFSAKQGKRLAAVSGFRFVLPDWQPNEAYSTAAMASQMPPMFLSFIAARQMRPLPTM